MTDSPAVPKAPRKGGSGLGAALLGGGILGAVLLAISQFMTLFNTHVAAVRAPVDSVTVGSQHAYALLPVAVAALVLVYGFWSAGSRPALLAVGALGLVALVISLAKDLPDAHKTGVRTVASHFVSADNDPAIGLYAETLGAMILLITCVSGFILIGPPQPQPAGAVRESAPSSS
jgi:hypothetical protein